MLPCAIRRRSASGVMSTSSTCSAARTTESGTVSRCGTPVIASTTSLSDSRCWTLTVLITSMPASSSCLDVLPALLVLDARGRWCAPARRPAPPAGARAQDRVRDPSPRTARRGTRRSGAGRLEAAERSAVCGRPCVSTKPTTTSVPRSARRRALVEHRVGLADARGGAEVDAQLPRLPRHAARRRPAPGTAAVRAARSSCRTGSRVGSPR